MGHRYTTDELLDGLDVEPFTRHCYSSENTDRDLTIFRGFIAGMLFTASDDDGEPAAAHGLVASAVHTGILCDSWRYVAAFIRDADDVGGLAFLEEADDSDDMADSLGIKLAFSSTGEGAGLWDSPEFRHLDDFASHTLDTWYPESHFTF